MNAEKKFVTFNAFKDFVGELTKAYIEAEDYPIKLSKEHLAIMSPLGQDCSDMVTELIRFLDSNREALREKTLPLPDPIICLDEDAFIDVSRLLEKEDDNQEIIYKHLNIIDRLAKGEILSNEQRVFKETISNLVDSLPIDTIKLEDNATPDTAVKTLMPLLIQSIERNLELFKQSDIDKGRVAKIACLAVRGHLQQGSELPFFKFLSDGDGGSKIKTDELLELVDMLIEEDDLSKCDLSTTIIEKLSSSGLIANLPFDSIFQIASSSALQ